MKYYQILRAIAENRKCFRVSRGNFSTVTFADSFEKCKGRFKKGRNGKFLIEEISLQEYLEEKLKLKEK